LEIAPQADHLIMVHAASSKAQRGHQAFRKNLLASISAKLRQPVSAMVISSSSRIGHSTCATLDAPAADTR